MAAFLPLAWALAATPADYQWAQRKIDSIDGDRLKPGARVELTPRELNAYAEHYVPQGVRNPQVQVTAPETATGSALVDFGKLQRSMGHPPGWLLSKLLDGERPVSVTARIRSAGGQATVEVQRVQVSGRHRDRRRDARLPHPQCTPAGVSQCRGGTSPSISVITFKRSTCNRAPSAS